MRDLKESNYELKRKQRAREEEVMDLRFRLENVDMLEKQNEVVVSRPSIVLMDKKMIWWLL